jgi:hypothetical protein
MGYRHDSYYRLVARIHNRPVSELLHDLFAQVPLDQTCKIKINVYGDAIDSHEDAMEMYDEPKGGEVKINFTALFYRNWKSPTLDAAKAFVESKKYYAILAAIDYLDDDALMFGLEPYHTIAKSVV